MFSGHVPEKRSVSEPLKTVSLLHRALASRCTSHWCSILIHAHNIAKHRDTHSFYNDIVSCGDSGVMWSFEFRLSAGEGFGRCHGKWWTSI